MLFSSSVLMKGGMANEPSSQYWDIIISLPIDSMSIIKEPEPERKEGRAERKRRCIKSIDWWKERSGRQTQGGLEHMNISTLSSVPTMLLNVDLRYYQSGVSGGVIIKCRTTRTKQSSCIKNKSFSFHTVYTQMEVNTHTHTVYTQMEINMKNIWNVFWGN